MFVPLACRPFSPSVTVKLTPVLHTVQHEHKSVPGVTQTRAIRASWILAAAATAEQIGARAKAGVAHPFVATVQYDEDEDSRRYVVRTSAECPCQLHVLCSQYRCSTANRA